MIKRESIYFKIRHSLGGCGFYLEIAIRLESFFDDKYHGDSTWKL